MIKESIGEKAGLIAVVGVLISIYAVFKYFY